MVRRRLSKYSAAVSEVIIAFEVVARGNVLHSNGDIMTFHGVLGAKTRASVIHNSVPGGQSSSIYRRGGDDAILLACNIILRVPLSSSCKSKFLKFED